MAVSKLSQIAASAPAATTDQIVGVIGGTTDALYSIEQILDLFGSAQGDILYRDSSVWKVLAPGTNGFVLTTGGAGANPSWVSGPPATLVIGSSSISGGVAGGILFDSGPGTLEESSKLTFNGTQTVSINGGIALVNIPSISTFFDGGAGNTTLTGADNFATGPGSLMGLTTGQRNTALGVNALQSATADSENVAMGFQALQNLNNTTLSNIAMGSSAMGNFTSGSHNVAMGKSAMLGIFGSSTGSFNVGIGDSALQNITTGGNNVAIGQSAIKACSTASDNMALGANALLALQTGNDNVAIGGQALQSSVADSQNVAVGHFALVSLNGNGNNTCIGFAAGQNITTGATNLVLGYNESTITSGSTNIAIGNAVGVPSATANNQLVIGNYIYGTNLSHTGSSVSPGQIGIGITAPTASLHLQASTTGQANLRFDPTSAAGPTSPNDGDLWYDGTHLNFRLGAVTHVIV